MVMLTHVYHACCDAAAWPRRCLVVGSSPFGTVRTRKSRCLDSPMEDESQVFKPHDRSAFALAWHSRDCLQGPDCKGVSWDAPDLVCASVPGSRAGQVPGIASEDFRCDVCDVSCQVSNPNSSTPGRRRR